MRFSDIYSRITGFCSRICGRVFRGWSPALWVWLYVMGMLTVMDILPSYTLHLSDTAITILMAGVPALKATLLTMLLTPMLRHRVLRVAAWCLVALYSVIALTNAFCYILYDFGISRRLLFVLAQTNPSETAGFLPGLLSNLRHIAAGPGLWVMAALTVALMLLWRRGGRWVTAATILLTLLGIAGMGWFAATRPMGRTAFFMTLRIPKYAMEVVRSNRAYSKIASMKRPLADAESVRSACDTDVVLVIGESASSGHLGAYGYPLPTTPRLSAMSDSVVIFHRAIGSSLSTAMNMERLLTFMPDDNGSRQWYEYPLMMQLFNQAGYLTAWLSMQERSGMLADNSAAIASDASIVKYLSKTSSEDEMIARFDEVVIPEAAAVLGEDRPAFVAIHLMGSHTAYADRVPPGRSVITARDVLRALPRPYLDEEKAAVVAAYDNSIRYTDSIVGVLTDRVAAQRRPAVLIYLSDHGENVYDTRDFIGRDPAFVRVPLTVYCNAAYRAARPEMWRRIKAAAEKRVSTADMIHAIMSITSTGYPAYEAGRDFTSAEYDSLRTMMVDDEPYRWR